MNELCHQLSIRTIAEFAETTEIVEDLRKLGVDYVQGYAIGKPAPWTAETMRKVF
jgi:EAL domain-containing protein (putative c-di-GMP-specific phosphodiesterase class I)